MAQAQEPQHDPADKYKLVRDGSDNEPEFDEWQQAQNRMNELLADFDELQPDDFQIEPVYENGSSESAEADSDEPDTPEFKDRDEPDAEPVEVVEADSTPAVSDPENLPKISPVEDTAQDVISQLNSDDMHRLVWDPEADPQSVPYDVRGLPYDRPEPSAEAFDLFAGIIEGALDVQYSVEEVEFEETDKTYNCTVVIEKQSGQGTKRLVGVKTRQKSRTTGIDHWRSRIYSKARRNCLKQDIPPTMVSSLLARYRELEA